MHVKSQRLFVFTWTFAIALSLCANSLAQFGGGKGEAPIDDTPKDTVVLTVWVLTLGDSAEHAADESKSHLAERLNNMPAVFDSLKAVREFVGHLKSAGRMRSSRELRLVTLDGQTAQVQIGASKPRVVATTMRQDGRTANSLTMESVGTLVEVVTRIDSENFIQVKFDYSASELEKSKDVALDVPAEGKPRLADFVASHQFKTTARVKSGTAVVVQSDSSSGSEDRSADGQVALIILGGAIEPAKD